MSGIRGGMACSRLGRLAAAEFMQTHSSSARVFCDHHTSNHLANNGRGLYIIGAVLEDEQMLDLGGQILTRRFNDFYHLGFY